MSSSKCPRPMVVQTLIFTKKLYEPFDVYAWLEEKGFKDDRVEETGVSYRARQHDPNLFVEGSLRTISMGRGQSDVRAVVGCPIMSLWSQIQAGREERKALKALAKTKGLPAPAPLRKATPKLSPAWTKAASAARRAERRVRAAERGLPAGKTASLDVTRRLLAAPPASGMSFKEWARREGIDLSSAGRAEARRAWKGRRR